MRQQSSARAARMNSDSPTRLSQLIADHLDEGLDAERRKQLNQALKSSSEARAEFVAALRQDILLGEVLRERTESAVTPTRAANPDVSGPVAHSRRSWWLVAGAAAAM